MLLNSVTVGNYRSFVEKTKFELRPLTLVFGQNGAGKSALIRALPLLAASMDGRPGQPLALDSAANRGARFQDILAARPIRKDAILRLELQLGGANADKPPLSVQWDLREIPERKQVFVDRIYAVQSDLHFEARMAVLDDIKKLGRYYDVTLGNEVFAGIEMGFDGLLPNVQEFLSGKWGASPSASVLFRILQLRQLAYETQWLTSVRLPPPRFSLYKGFSPLRLSFDGSAAADALAYDELVGGDVLPLVSSWFEKNTKQTLQIQKANDYFSLVLGKVTDSPFVVNFADAGEGLIQVLPVLVACTMAAIKATDASTSVVAVEEPECHLHPNLHAPLAEHLCMLIRRNSNVRYVVETHSEILLLATQIAIARGDIDPSQVIVYWARQSADGRSYLDPITFDLTGKPHGDWPRSVFKEDVAKAKVLFELQHKEWRNASSHT